MAWNEPGNSGKDRDPWGNSGKNQTSPDLDKVLRNFLQKLSALLGGRRPGGDVGGLGISLVLMVAVVAWVISGFYTIREAERGVVLRFGKFYQSVEPGLRWKATFIDQVIPVDVESVRSLPAAGFVLTQDENVVRVEMDVQYRVSDARKYLFSVTNADDSLSQATDSALRYVVGHTTMDEVLTRGREKVRQDTWQELEKTIEPYDMGITVVDVNFLPARPPEEVKDAFDDAISAQEDEERFIREAEAYAREVEPKARGQVKRLEEEAQGYKQQIVLKATGEVARFNEMLPQYLAAPQLTRERIYLDTMEEIYSKVNKVVVDLPEGNNSMIYLPLDKLVSGKTGDAIRQSAPAAPTPRAPADELTSETMGQASVPLRSSDRSGGRY
ncbi:MAG: FtsH protease activity modulator HflK [Aeromonadaceae bacterium]|nr:FtsH protease activity modulator HflK [Aeromonadaceae bacterium]MBP9568840.1 FtsH protease activity modulator HflK [Aeromonadaceae bacterium]